MTRWIVLGTLVIRSAVPVSAQTLTVARERSEETVARTVALAAPVALGAAPSTIETPGHDSIVRVHAMVTGGSAAGWTLGCQPGRTAGAARPLDTGEAWSFELINSRGERPKSVTCELHGPQGGVAPSVSVDRVGAAIPPNATPQGMTPPRDQSEPIIKKAGAVRAWARAVGRLTFAAADGFHYYCTTFLVTKELMLTNEHCINTDAAMRSALVDFDYDDDKPSETVGFRELVTSNRGLDYALLRLAQPSTRTPLVLKETALTERKALAIIQHPNGEPKKVSLVQCEVRGVSMAGITAMTDFGHYCDTFHGSSGSPVQEFPSGNVVGLHHLGYEEGDKPLNRGVMIGLILKDIRTSKPAVGTEIP